MSNISGIGICYLVLRASSGTSKVIQRWQRKERKKKEESEKKGSNKISWGSSLLPHKPPHDDNKLDTEGEQHLST